MYKIIYVILKTKIIIYNVNDNKINNNTIIKNCNRYLIKLLINFRTYLKTLTSIENKHVLYIERKKFKKKNARILRFFELSRQT